MKSGRLYDDAGILSADPRCRYGFIKARGVIVVRNNGRWFVRFTQVNDTGTVRLAQGLFGEQACYERCVWPTDEPNAPDSSGTRTSRHSLMQPEWECVRCESSSASCRALLYGWTRRADQCRP
jgi:hypothetical protein